MDIEGKDFGVYTVLNCTNDRDKCGHLLYNVKCNICNQTFVKRSYDIRQRNSKCNHLNDLREWENKRLGRIFNGMIKRCYSVDDKNYLYYGAKNIKICEKWLNDKKQFEIWSFQNGYNNNLTIDRIESNKDYSPDNCRWVTNKSNSRYKSTTNIIEINGMFKSGREWSEYLNKGINYINRMIRDKGIDYTIDYIKNNI